MAHTTKSLLARGVVDRFLAGKLGAKVPAAPIVSKGDLGRAASASP